jgi:hypothetical protein
MKTVRTITEFTIRHPEDFEFKTKDSVKEMPSELIFGLEYDEINVPFGTILKVIEEKPDEDFNSGIKYLSKFENGALAYIDKGLVEEIKE